MYSEKNIILKCEIMSRGILKSFWLDGGYYTVSNLMLVVKDSTSKQTQRQTGGREGGRGHKLVWEVHLVVII